MESRGLCRTAALLYFVLLSPDGRAEIYKCLNDKGQVHYTDAPCNARDEAEGLVTDDLLNANVVRLPDRADQPGKSRSRRAESAVTPSEGRHLLDYAEKIEIQNLEAAKVGRDKALRAFYEQEIERVRRGLFGRLSFDDRTARNNHLGTIGLRHIEKAEVRSAIKGIEAIYAGY